MGDQSEARPSKLLLGCPLSDARFLRLSLPESPELERAMIEAGAAAFVTKDKASADLVRTIREDAGTFSAANS